MRPYLVAAVGAYLGAAVAAEAGATARRDDWIAQRLVAYVAVQTRFDSGIRPRERRLLRLLVPSMMLCDAGVVILIGSSDVILIGRSMSLIVVIIVKNLQEVVSKSIELAGNKFL